MHHQAQPSIRGGRFILLKYMPYFFIKLSFASGGRTPPIQLETGIRPLPKL
jgi:hypothetical protein